MFYAQLQNNIKCLAEKEQEKNSFPQESCFTYANIKLYNFSMLINVSAGVLQVPESGSHHAYL